MLTTKVTISHILGIENNDNWQVISSDDNVHLVHYSQNADLNQYSSLRGVVVDTEEKRIVCSSFGYAPSFTVDYVEEGVNTVVDEYDKVHNVDLTNAKFRIGYEGTILRVFKHKGKVYYSTHRRLDASKSTWGNTKTFTEMYSELGGPTEDELFPEDIESPPYVYVFLVSHPDVMMCSHVPTQTGFIVFLGRLDMSGNGNDEELPFKHRLITDRDVIDLNEEQGIISSRYLSTDEANKFLRTGFHNLDNKRDKRLSHGEFVIAEVPNGEQNNYPGENVSLYKFASPAYEWRCNMRGKDSNLYHRFFALATDSYGKKPLEKYYREYPIVPCFVHEEQVKELLQQGWILEWPNNKRQNVLATKKKPSNKELLYNIWACFLLSVPLAFQEKVADFLSSYSKDRIKVVDWLLEKYDDEEFAEPRRAADILEIADERTARDAKDDTYDAVLRSNISKLVHREYGLSLYKLVNAMKKDQ